jgi:hypothetical protein
MTAVSEKDIRDARHMVEDLEDISPCFTAATAVAGLARLAARGTVPSDHTVLVNLTGADRSDGRPPKNVHWLERTSSGWRPADPHDRLSAELWE